jgi:hypothetical protein
MERLSERGQCGDTLKLVSIGAQRWLVSVLWLCAFLVLYLGSTDRGVRLLGQMIAWSLVGLAFGFMWFAARDAVESRWPPTDTKTLRRYRWLQAGLWLAVVILFILVSVGVSGPVEGQAMGFGTLFAFPTWLGFEKIIEPRSSQPI